jgi:hypothetical protein
MMGPVQLMVIGYRERVIPTSLRAEIQKLKANPAVRIVDILAAYKNRDGTLETEQVADLVPEHVNEPGAILNRLMTMAGAARTVGQTSETGPGYLFEGDMLPDPRDVGPSGAGALALLLEHRWAIALRDAAADTRAFPLATEWVGRKTLYEVEELVEGA